MGTHTREAWVLGSRVNRRVVFLAVGRVKGGEETSLDSEHRPR